MNVDHGMRVQTIINQEQAKKDLQSISSEMSAGPVLILRHCFKLRPRNVFQMFQPYPLARLRLKLIRQPALTISRSFSVIS